MALIFNHLKARAFECISDKRIVCIKIFHSYITVIKSAYFQHIQSWIFANYSGNSH